MLIRTLRKGESLVAEGHFELYFDGTDENGEPILGLQIPGKAYIDRLDDVLYGAWLVLGETRVQLNRRQNNRVTLCLDAPKHVRFSHGNRLHKSTELHHAAK